MTARLRLPGIALLLALVYTPASGQRPPQELFVHASPITGYATFVAPQRSDLKVGLQPGGHALTHPNDVLAQYGHLFGISDQAAELVASAKEFDELGDQHTHYDQVFGGVRVFSGAIKVHQRKESLRAVNGHFYPIPRALGTIPSVALDAAHLVALAGLSAAAPRVEESALVIVDPGWWGNVSHGPRLAYHLIVADPSVPMRQSVFVDAHTAAVLDRWSLLESARNRQIHNANNIFGNIPGPVARFEGRGPTGIAEVDRAFDYAGDTHGYYLRAFGRDSIDGRGAIMRATVQAVSGCPNAFFIDRGLILGPQAVFCFGLTSDDVVAHEFTHGVTRFSANLIYQNQPGQLNESFSDVFGELIDLFNGNAGFAGPPGGPPFWPLPVPYVGPGTDIGNQKRPDLPLNRCSPPPLRPDGVRWLVGEDTIIGDLRDMWNPTCFNNPERVTSALYRCGPGDNGSVHSGSGVPNHAFAILTDGKNFNGQNVIGIGPIKAGAVWYRALTRYLTPASNFQDAYLALNQAAADLVNVQLNDPRTGLAGPVFTAFDAVQVDSALRAVEMNLAVPCGGAARSFIFVIDTTGSAAGANAYYNNVIANLTRLLGRIAAPTQFAIARFDDYPCLPHGASGDVPYRLITPFVTASQIAAFLPVTGPGQGADAPESQLDAIVTALTGRALVPRVAGCGPGVPAGQGAFGPGQARSPTLVYLLTTPRLFHLPAPGKPHVNRIADITALVNVISSGRAKLLATAAALPDEDSVLATLVTISFGADVEPLPTPDESTNFKTLLAAVRNAGGSGATFQGNAGGEVCVAKRACVFSGGDSACVDPGDVDADGDNLADACTPLFASCDINQDGAVDKDDINLIFQARNVPAIAGDPRDIDGDGLITVNDARICSLQCTKPGCAP